MVTTDHGETNDATASMHQQYIEQSSCCMLPHACNGHCRYPKIIVDCKEEQAQTVGDVEIPVDTSQPNPNGIEFDNLYLVRQKSLFFAVLETCQTCLPQQQHGAPTCLRVVRQQHA